MVAGTEASWPGEWVASRYGDYRHAAPRGQRKTLCGIRYALMRPEHVRHQQVCPRCVKAIGELAGQR